MRLIPTLLAAVSLLSTSCFSHVIRAAADLNLAARQKPAFLPRPITASESMDSMLHLRGGAGPLGAVDAAMAGSVIALTSGTITASESMDIMLQLRGGSGPLGAVDTAKAGSVIALTSGVLHSLSAGKMLELYDSERTIALENCLRTVGTSVLSVAIPSWCLLNGKCSSVNTAVGLSILPWILQFVKSVVDQDQGINVGMQACVLLYNVFTAHALFTDAAYATKALQVFCIWILANGAFLTVSPQTASISWGGSTEDQVVSFTRTIGYGLLAYGTFITSLSRDIDIVKAFGYSLIPWLVENVSRQFVLKEVEKYGQDSRMQLFWLLYFVISIASTAM